MGIIKPKTGDSPEIITGTYESSDERGGISSGPRSSSSTKISSQTGFYSIPDEKKEVVMIDGVDDEEPIIFGEVNPDGIRKYDGTLLQQGERYITNKERTGNISIHGNGKIVSTSFSSPFIKIGDNGEVISKNNSSAYQMISQIPSTGEIIMETGIATLSNDKVTYKKNGSISINKQGIINLN